MLSNAECDAANFLLTHEFAIKPGKPPVNQWSVNTANRVKTGGAAHLATLPLDRLPEQAKILRKDGFHDEAQQMESYHAGESAKQAALKAAQPAAPAPQTFTSTVTNTTPVPGYVSHLDPAARKKALLAFHKHPDAAPLLEAHGVNQPGIDKKEALTRLNAAYEALHIQNSKTAAAPTAAQPAASPTAFPQAITRNRRDANEVVPTVRTVPVNKAAIIDPRVSPHPPEPNMSWMRPKSQGIQAEDAPVPLPIKKPATDAELNGVRDHQDLMKMVYPNGTGFPMTGFNPSPKSNKTVSDLVNGGHGIANIAHHYLSRSGALNQAAGQDDRIRAAYQQFAADRQSHMRSVPASLVNAAQPAASPVAAESPVAQRPVWMKPKTVSPPAQPSKEPSAATPPQLPAFLRRDMPPRSDQANREHHWIQGRTPTSALLPKMYVGSQSTVATRPGSRAAMRQIASQGQQDAIAPKFGGSSHSPGRFAQLLQAARAGKLKEHLENGLGNFFDRFEHHGNKLLRKIGIPAGEEFSRREVAAMEFLLTSEFARHKPDDRQRGFVFDAPAKKGTGWTPPVVERKAKQKSFGWREEQHPRESAAHDSKRPGEFAKKDESHTEEPKTDEKPKYVAKGNEVFGIDGVRHAAFRNEDKAKAAAEDWNLNGKPNGQPKPVAPRVIPEDLYPSLKDNTPNEMTTDQLVDHLNGTLQKPDSQEPEEQVADKTPAEDLASAAKEHLSDEVTQASIPGMEPEMADETPREAAERQDKALDSDYEFARQSSVRNAGEDLKGSARHKRNEWRGLDAAEENGTAATQVTRDNLLKSEPHDLASLAEANPLTSLVGYFAIRKFPAKPGFGDERRRSNIDEETNKKDRKQFLETYQEYKAKVESLAKEQHDPLKAIDELHGWVKDKISDLRGVDKDKRNDYMARAGLAGTDKYNNTANSLVDTLKSLQRGYRPKTTSVAGRLLEFSKLAAEAHSEDLDLEALTEHVQDIIEGRSMPESFGKKGSKADQFKAADAYVSHAIRKGGRDVSALTKSPEKSVDSIIGKFGARGVQWGNSVTDDERVHHSAKIVEALSDLADITGLKPSDLSLGGKVGWAIGARGHGNALAHYEPWSQVINMTRKSGVGALAHEWGHAFDHSHSDFAKKGSESYMSANKLANRYNSKERKIEKVKSDDPIQNAYEELRDAWESSGFNTRLKKRLDELVNQKRMSSEKAYKYWDSNHEKFARSFERFVQHKLRSSDRDNTYLSGLADKKENSLWPNDSEISAMAPAFEKVFETYRKKKYGDEKTQEFSRSEAADFLSQSEFACSLSNAITAFTGERASVHPAA